MDLRTLLLAGCGLQHVPAAIVHCNALQELSLENNRIAVLPPGLRDLPNLTRLGLAGNRLTLPPAGSGSSGTGAAATEENESPSMAVLEALPGLRELSLHGNAMRHHGS